MDQNTDTPDNITTLFSVAVLKDLRHYKWNASARRDRQPGCPKDVFFFGTELAHKKSNVFGTLTLLFLL